MSGHHHQPARQQGFSLLELLVAFTISTMVLVSVYQVYIKGNQTAMLGRDYARAVVVAESKLAGFDGLEQVGRVSGTEQRKFDWQLSVEPHQTGHTSLLRLNRISIEVSWKTAGKARSIYLTTLKPEKSS